MKKTPKAYNVVFVKLSEDESSVDVYNDEKEEDWLLYVSAKKFYKVCKNKVKLKPNVLTKVIADIYALS